MSRITCILDACSVINLIHIDQDEFLLKKLKHLDVRLCQKVFKEVDLNVFDRLAKKSYTTSELKIKKKSIDQNLSLFRTYQVTNNDVVKDFGDSFFDKIKMLTNYSKDNGEFYSTALACYLSQTEPTKLFFYTDDFPATLEFQEFYRTQQIGYIEDTADLLMLLFRLCDDFSKIELNKALSRLFSEYASEATILEKKLKKYKEGLTTIQRRKKDLITKLDTLISKLSKHEFNGINAIKDFFQMNRSRNKTICEILDSNSVVFNLEGTENNLLKKIPVLRKLVDEDRFFKF